MKRSNYLDLIKLYVQLLFTISKSQNF